MKVMIAGGTGFLGRSLESFFLEKGWQVFILTRNPKAKNHVFWDGITLGDWVSYLNQSQLLINLCGKSVDCRYTAKNRKQILESRLLSTTLLQKAMSECEAPPKVWLNSSSATIYIHAEEQPMTEQSGIIGDDFSMRVCKAWEQSFFNHPLPKTRKIALRTSIVLGNTGGAFPKLRSITKWGLGGTQGNGRQWVSWIHLTDFCEALWHCYQHEDLSGPINITAPNPVKNRDFMLALRQQYRKVFGLTAPQPLLELASWVLQTESELLLKSRYVFPHLLEQSGFHFKYPNLKVALKGLQ